MMRYAIFLIQLQLVHFFVQDCPCVHSAAKYRRFSDHYRTYDGTRRKCLMLKCSPNVPDSIHMFLLLPFFDIKIGRLHAAALGKLVLESGDVERNPGPVKRRGGRRSFADTNVLKRKKARHSLTDPNLESSASEPEMVGVAELPTRHEIEQHYAGILPDGIKCSHCDAYRWKSEPASLCCSLGKVKLPKYPEPPQMLKDLYNYQDFVKNIRKFNNAFALASIGCREIRQAGFNPTFRIQGKIYHRIGSLCPHEGTPAQYAQLFFCDQQQERRQRRESHPELSPKILEKLEECIHSVNPHVKLIRTAAENYVKMPELKVIFSARAPEGLDAYESRTFTVPEAGQVAAVVPASDLGYLDVVLEMDGGVKHVNELHRLYDPLSYILLLIYGSSGFHAELRKSYPRLSILQFYKFHMQIRDKSFNQFFRSGKLAQQYVCDQYVKVERFRMRWYRENQTHIRAEKYSGLLDAADSEDQFLPGNRIILPPTHYGSPRWYVNSFQDAMALVREYGKPDLFVTMTCNPNWPEILGSLLPGQQASDRPDLCVRVFYQKVCELIRVVTKEHWLGRVKAYTAMKEDQKRGLPHLHLLLVLADTDKPNSPEAADRLICAEIPDPIEHPKLFSIIKSCNIHGPCGQLNYNSPCMKERATGRKECTKGYPRPFNNAETTFNNKSYPTYRRRDALHGGLEFVLKVRGRDVTVDNTMVIPHNKRLSLYFGAHINVEVVQDTGAVKYLYKYITKGSDKTMYSIAAEQAPQGDEIEQFMVARFVSSSEAYWRMYEFPLKYMHPPVMKLALHLENEQVVILNLPEKDSMDRDGTDSSTADLINEVVEKGPPKTTLTEFFELCKSDPVANLLEYPNVCKYFAWDGQKKIWKRRKRNVSVNRNSGQLSDMVGRIPVLNLNPKQSELFYLRMLLHNVKGPKSFCDLRTVNGIEHSTYKSACLELGLLEYDDEMDKAMEEAASEKFGPRLRELFATILAFFTPVDAKRFWEKHKLSLCDDIWRLRNAGQCATRDEDMALSIIQKQLDAHGLCLRKNFGIFFGDSDTNELESETDNTVLKNVVAQNVPKLTEEQNSAYQRVLESVDGAQGRCFALDAPGGTGKTFLLTTILAQVRAKNKVAIACATSGLAATLIPNGRTVHSALKVPIVIDEHSMCMFTANDAVGQKVRKCELLVIDEFSMGHRYMYEAIDRSFRDVRGSDKIFGGVTVLLSGDWRQCLPVVKKGGRSGTIDACLKFSLLWRHIESLQLTKNMRLELQDDFSKKFEQYLLQVGEDKISSKNGYIPIPKQFLLENNSLSGLCNFIYEHLDDKYYDPIWLSERAVLTPLNDVVKKVNAFMIDRFPGRKHRRRSADKVLDENSAHLFPVEFLNSLDMNMPPHNLELKVGCPLMLLRNLDPIHGHCNGTRYILTQIHQYLLDCTVSCGLNVGVKKLIPRIPIIPSGEDMMFRMQRTQYPVRLCFGMTINKAQGQSLYAVGLLLDKNVFSHGQLYVALSRCKNPKAIRIIYPEKSDGEKEPVMRNIVYDEVLSKFREPIFDGQNLTAQDYSEEEL